MTTTHHPGGLIVRSERDGDSVLLQAPGVALSVEKIVLNAIVAQHVTQLGHAIVVDEKTLIELLEQTVAMIREGDSMTGSIEYRWGSKPGSYDVIVFQRTGNSHGQGGVRMIGQFPMPEEDW